MKWLSRFLNLPFPAHLAMGYRFQITLAFSLFVILFMLYFEPVDLSVIAPAYRKWVIVGYGAICFALMGIDMIWIPRVFRNHIKEGRWKVYKHMLTSLWLFTTSTLTILFYNYQLGISEFSMAGFANTMVQIFGIVFIPSVMAILILYNYYYRVNLTTTLKLQSAFSQASERESIDTEEILTIADVNQKEILKLRPRELIMIRSADNYVTVYWLENESVQHKLFRQTMKFLDKHLTALGTFFRCHRTTIVNLKRIRQITGNALECRLVMEGINEEIPVSRNKRKSLHKMLLST